MSRLRKEKRDRAAAARNESQDGTEVTTGKAFYEIVEVGVAEWCPNEAGVGPTQVHLRIFIRGLEYPIVMRIKSREAADALIAILEKHTENVWPSQQETNAEGAPAETK